MPRFRFSWSIVTAFALAPLLSGCLAKTALDVVTAPVKVAGKAVDMTTTSQSEADEKRGRALRQREERLGELERRYWKLDRQCRNGDDTACADRGDVASEIEAIRPTVPAGRY